MVFMAIAAVSLLMVGIVLLAQLFDGKRGSNDLLGRGLPPGISRG